MISLLKRKKETLISVIQYHVMVKRVQESNQKWFVGQYERSNKVCNILDAIFQGTYLVYDLPTRKFPRNLPTLYPINPYKFIILGIIKGNNYVYFQ